MVDLAGLLEESADLHDVVVLAVHLDLTKQLVQLDIEDFNINFKGLPEYKGQAGGTIELSGFNKISLELEAVLGPLNIFSFFISNAEEVGRFEIKFWPSGHISGDYKDSKISTV